MSVKVVVIQNEKSVSLEIAKPNNTQVLEIIRGVFAVFGTPLPTIAPDVPTAYIKAIAEKTPANPFKKSGSGKTPEPEKADAKDDVHLTDSIGITEAPATPIPKQVTFVNASRTLTTSLAEKLGPLLEQSMSDDGEAVGFTDGTTAEENNDVKIINDVEHYRTRVYCKNAACGKRSNRWIPVRQKSVQCPHCKTMYVRRDATAQGFPNQDEYGNYFKADNLWINHFKSQQERAKSPVR
ncbi:hypothetical protein POF51_13315 [Brevibacillus sp. AG]|uniref:hypothetical protein n=1 Tax=Brevibacillus sp. AG TaxID=3020891 RepID=UPI00232B9A6A|nr:hypothetical protein [Brevibacillus sp. AG]MDC0761679.1 hypothetical protein [Brevibacillus sp. AG]